VLGHPEYETTRIYDEYTRDISEGKAINLPFNYFPNDDDKLKPTNTWNAHSNLLFANWLNYHVYQITPFDVMKI
jgi:homoserine O-succinyltransferase